jgi:hypothetical protein
MAKETPSKRSIFANPFYAFIRRVPVHPDKRETYENICNRIVRHFARLSVRLRNNVYSDKVRLRSKQIIHIRGLPEGILPRQMGRMHDERILEWSFHKSIGQKTFEDLTPNSHAVCI